MIFKTFNSDIDKWTAKIGVFGKSFNDIFEARNKKKLDIDDLITFKGMSLDEAKKQVGSFWSYLYPKKEDIQALQVSIPNLIDTTKANEYLDIMKQIDAGTHEFYSSYQDWFDKILVDGEKWIAKYAQSTQGQIRSLEGVTEANKAARDSAIAHNAALKQQTLSAKAGQIALKGLSIAGNMLAMWAITKGIELAAKAIDQIVNSAKYCKERVDEAMESFNSMTAEINANAKTISEISGRYAELSKHVNRLGENVSLTEDEFEEYHTITSKIAEMYPSLVDGWDSQGNAIVNLTGDLKELNEEYEKALHNANLKLIEFWIPSILWDRYWTG